MSSLELPDNEESKIQDNILTALQNITGIEAWEEHEAEFEELLADFSLRELHTENLPNTVSLTQSTHIREQIGQRQISEENSLDILDNPKQLKDYLSSIAPNLTREQLDSLATNEAIQPALEDIVVDRTFSRLDHRYIGSNEDAATYLVELSNLSDLEQSWYEMRNTFPLHDIETLIAENPEFFNPDKEVEEIRGWKNLPQDKKNQILAARETYKAVQVMNRIFLADHVMTYLETQTTLTPEEYTKFFHSYHAIGSQEALYQGVNNGITNFFGEYRANEVRLREHQPPHVEDIPRAAKAFSSKLTELKEEVMSMPQEEREKAAIALCEWINVTFSCLQVFADGNKRTSTSLAYFTLRDLMGRDYADNHTAKFSGENSPENHYMMDYGLLKSGIASFYKQTNNTDDIATAMITAIQSTELRDLTRKES